MALLVELVEAGELVKSGESGGIVYCLSCIVYRVSCIVYRLSFIVGRALARQLVPRALARVRLRL